MALVPGGGREQLAAQLAAYLGNQLRGIAQQRVNQLANEFIDGPYILSDLLGAVLTCYVPCRLGHGRATGPRGHPSDHGRVHDHAQQSST